MNKFTFPLLIVITTICIYQFSKNKQNIKYINYMNEIIESKNLMINNLLKDDLYDINRDLYSYIYNIDSSLLENNQKTTLCIYISAEKHCDACIEFELKYIRKNALENNIIILYHASHKSSFNSFKEFNKEYQAIHKIKAWKTTKRIGNSDKNLDPLNQLLNNIDKSKKKNFEELP